MIALAKDVNIIGSQITYLTLVQGVNQQPGINQLIKKDRDKMGNKLKQIDKRIGRTCIYFFIVIPIMGFGTLLSFFSINPIADYILVSSFILFLGGALYHIFTIGKFVKILNQRSK